MLFVVPHPSIGSEVHVPLLFYNTSGSSFSCRAAGFDRIAKSTAILLHLPRDTSHHVFRNV